MNQDNEQNNNQSVELEVNRKNREDFEKLMKESSTQLDGYWDKNNSFVKVLLIGLLIFIVIGSIIVLSSYLGTK